jgi:putative acetyltransferase
MLIRAEEPRDRTAVHSVNEAAFDSPEEADLVDALRASARPVISLVAEAGGKVVGHIMFSPVQLEGHARLAIMGLAPMAVLQEHQRKGVGSALVRAGLERCREIGCDAVVVLGHPEYYPRFGFAPASSYGLRSEYAVPDDVFMVLELKQGALEGVSGKIRYHEAFGSV